MSLLTLNTLHLGDCIQAMKAMPDGFADLAIVDPPYGVGSITYMPSTRTPAVGGWLDKYDVTIATLDMAQRPGITTQIIHSKSTLRTIKNFGDINVSPPPEYFRELFRVSKNQMVFGGNYFLLPPSRCFIVWDKMRSEKFSMAMCELVWTSFVGNAKIARFTSEGRPNQRFHPTQKPVALYKWLISNYAKPGDLILDTHAGSASSLVAAYELGHDFIGYEIDPDYHAPAAARVKEAMTRQRLVLETESEQP